MAVIGTQSTVDAYHSELTERVVRPGRGDLRSFRVRRFLGTYTRATIVRHAIYSIKLMYSESVGWLAKFAGSGQ